MNNLIKSFLSNHKIILSKLLSITSELFSIFNLLIKISKYFILQKFISTLKETKSFLNKYLNNFNKTIFLFSINSNVIILITLLLAIILKKFSFSLSKFNIR